MFGNLRVGTVALLVMVAVIIPGALVAAVIIAATSAGSTPTLTSPAALAVATRSLPRYWVVHPGDTFTSIAAGTRLDVSQLAQLNPSQDPNALIPGQRLRLHAPTPKVHGSPRHRPPRVWVVHPGQTYSSIAARTGLAVADIAQLNPKVNPNAIVPGERLKLRP